MQPYIENPTYSQLTLLQSSIYKYKRCITKKDCLYVLPSLSLFFLTAHIKKAKKPAMTLQNNSSQTCMPHLYQKLRPRYRREREETQSE